MILAYPEPCRGLFITSQIGPVDANYLYSIMLPMHSAEGSSRKKVEDNIMDLFQDFLIKLEVEESISGYTEAISWAEDNDTSAELPQPIEKFQTADLSPAGLMGWMTGQKHKPLIDDKKFRIAVMFDHDCLLNNPLHRICFPVVGACARVITLPVAHMKTAAEFNEVFLLAYSKGQSFGKA